MNQSAKEPKYFQCGDCDHPFPESDAGEAVYECSTDGQPSVGERRCQLCNKFCAKVADMSCPECESYEDIAEITREEYDKEQEREQKKKMEAEERRRNPQPDPVLERVLAEGREHRAAMQEWWESEGRAAFADLQSPDSYDNLADKIGHFVIESGGLSVGLDVEEIKEIGEKMAMLERQVAEWSGSGDLE